jgi:hypothetical protein
MGQPQPVVQFFAVAFSSVWVIFPVKSTGLANTSPGAEGDLHSSAVWASGGCMGGVLALALLPVMFAHTMRTLKCQ